MKKIYLLVYTLAFLFNVCGVSGQISNNDITNQFWFNFNPTYIVTKQLSYYGRVGAIFIMPNEWNRIEMRAAAKYIPVSLLRTDVLYNEELHAGLDLSYTANKFTANRLELKPFQGYALKWPDIPFLSLHHFTRLEERFELNTRDWTNSFGLRMRYRAKLLIHFPGIGLEYMKKFYLAFFGEIFWNIITVKQFNDAFRLNVGTGYYFSKKMKAEFDIRYQYTKNFVDGSIATNDIVYKFSLHYTYD